MSGALPVTRGAFPHLRVAAGLAWVSGTSSRRVDNTIEGAAVTVDGTLQLDPVLQSRAVLANVDFWPESWTRGSAEVLGHVDAVISESHDSSASSMAEKYSLGLGLTPSRPNLNYIAVFNQ